MLYSEVQTLALHRNHRQLKVGTYPDSNNFKKISLNEDYA